MGPITSIIPTVRMVPCGGQMVKVAELRLRDLARLQAILDCLETDPLVAAQEKMQGLSDRDCDLILGQAYDIAELGPPVYGDTRAREYFSTPEGGSLFLWVALGRLNDISPVQAAAMYLESSGSEYGHVWRIAHGVSSLAAITQKMLPPIKGGDHSDSNAPTWSEMIFEIVERYGFSLDQVFDMTLSQWVFSRNGGKAPSLDRVIMPGEDSVAMFAEQKRRFFPEEITDQ